MIAPKSLTHLHLRNCIVTVLQARATDGPPLRVLDAGCGSGELMRFLHLTLRDAFPGALVEVYGFDVDDHGVQKVGFLGTALDLLVATDATVEWSRRLASCRVGEPWPYEADAFDVIVSNQVLEHVPDKASFFRNAFRCVKVDGHSFHLAPLAHCLFDGHVRLPLAHRFQSYDLLHAYLKATARLGLGKFREHHRRTGIPLDDFARRHADYLLFLTSYASQRETLALARAAGFRGDYTFTREFYGLKLRQVFGWPARERYRRPQSSVLNALSVRLLRYISSVTLCLHKANEYRDAGRVRPASA